ncbi:hypothetical protein QCA50_002591 [Cerrena zonata]|uniref:DUF6533 domain-containing protein n=1 Tax=Cerrena zonata TaxID=2478898 RepID=A0AAW0GK54_9APHY
MSDELGLTPDEAIFYISQIQLLNFLLAVALTLAVYDTILSFPKEVKCIWQGKFGTGPILYLFIRYGTVLNMFLELLSGFPVSKRVIYCYTPLNQDARAFDCVRIWSICQHAWIPTVLVFVLSMFEPAINIYARLPTFVGSYLVVPSGPLAHCWVGTDIIPYKYSLAVITRTISVTADAVVLGLTLWKTIYIFREREEVRAGSKLTTRLAYGGSMQFGLLLLLNILAVLLDILAVAASSTTFPNTSQFLFIQNVLTSIILSHFILNLRSTYLTTNNPSQTSSKQSSLHFASAVEGNMGSSLSGSWGSNIEEDEEDTEGVQYSDYPFAAGLDDIREASGSENVEEVPEAGPSVTTHDSEVLTTITGTGTSAVGGIGEIELQEIV